MACPQNTVMRGKNAMLQVPHLTTLALNAGTLATEKGPTAMQSIEEEEEAVPMTHSTTPLLLPIPQLLPSPTLRVLKGMQPMPF